MFVAHLPKDPLEMRVCWPDAACISFFCLQIERNVTMGEKEGRMKSLLNVAVAMRAAQLALDVFLTGSEYH